MQKQLGILFFLSLLISCASPGIPSGGPIDSEPPEVTKTVPENKTTGLTPYIIEVDFNEYIVLKDLQNQLIISPLIEPKPIVKVKNKTLTIDMSKCKLKESTTYVMNFGNSVVDFTEGNPIRGYTYVFSTGSYIDSLAISGTALDAFTLEKKEGITIELYKDLSDTAIYKVKPDYVTKTDKDGHFVLNYLAAGSYRLYAVDDANKNYLLNKDEKVGFLSEVIDLSANLDNVEIRYYQEGVIPKVTSVQQNAKGVFKFGFNTEVDYLLKNITLTDANSKNKRSLTYTSFFKDKDTAYFYTPDYIFEGLDSVNFKVEVGDSMYTIKCGLNPELVYNPIEISITENRIAPTDSLVFESKSPIKRLSEGKVKLMDLTDTTEVGVFLVEQVFEDQFSFYIKSNWKEGHQYNVILLDSIMVDVYGKYSGINKDTILNQTFRIKKEEETGTLKLKLVLPKLDTFESYDPESDITKLMVSPSDYIVQLVDTRDNVELEFYINNLTKEEYNITLKYLIPKEYRIKIILEGSNYNKRWDAGYLKYFIQPEMVFYYPKTLNIRANWEIDGIIITLPS